MGDRAPVNFFHGILPVFDSFVVGESPSGARPIYPKYDGCPENPLELPQGCLPVLMSFVGKQFVSLCSQISPIPFSDQEQFKAMYDATDFKYDFNEDQLYYFIFTEQELNDAGVDITRRPGCNHWNPEKLRYEPRAFIIENTYETERNYTTDFGSFPVCYRYEGSTLKSNLESLPIFDVEFIKTSWCFLEYFRKSFFQESDWTSAFFFIEFTSAQLKTARIDVPENLTGYKWDPYNARFEMVERPNYRQHGWDPTTERWMPICACDGCESGKLEFRWTEPDRNLLRQALCSYHDQTSDDRDSAHTGKPFLNLFSRRNGSGPYCSCNCFCSEHSVYHPPGEQCTCYFYNYVYITYRKKLF